MGRGSIASAAGGSGRSRGIGGGTDRFRLGRRSVSARDLEGVVPHISAAQRAGESGGRKARIREALRSGRTKFAEPIRIGVDARGKIDIGDGRHRIEVLREPEFRHVKLNAVFYRKGRPRR